jgi:broad specificity polyphosphatase/5'/3'-nucleotidase SurE
MTRFNYVNAYPVTAMRYGIQNLSQPILDAEPDLAVAGFNVGANAGNGTVHISGTVGAATEAAILGVPAIAFSGGTGTQVGWETATQSYQSIYANLSTTLVNALTKTSKPYLPTGIWLNVNYAAVNSGSCSAVSQFTWVLTRIVAGTGNDVQTCNSTTLPAESTVLAAGCYATVSVAWAANKSDTDAANQKTVLDKIGTFFSCAP